MDDDEALDMIIEHLRSRFPKTCTSCGREYAHLRDYLIRTAPVGDPISYDAEAENWQPTRPAGTVALANCACGSTLSIGSGGLALVKLWRLMWWARKNTRSRGITMTELLVELRNEIDERVTGRSLDEVRKAQ